MKKWMLGVALAVPVTLLTACSGRPTQALARVMEPVLPSIENEDFYRRSCTAIWNSSNTNQIQMAAYWLRVSECADQIPFKSRREFAASLPSTSWHGQLKKTLVELRDSPSLTQRRRALDTLSGLRDQVPSSVLPLVRLWREQQVTLISATDERSRAQREMKQLEMDVAELRAERQMLHRRLDDAEQKLRRLMDIERQLSVRKLVPVKPILPEQDDSVKPPELAVPSAEEPLPPPLIPDQMTPDQMMPDQIKEPQADDTEKDSKPAAGR
ncbi:MAG: hypothetical protein ACRCR6_08990 [Plesiomonas sp.]